MTFLVKGDHAVRPVEDLFRRTVVRFEPDHFRVGPVLFEVEDVRDLGAAPPVDRLVVVADHAEVTVRKRQSLDDPVLAQVGVLILIDQEVVEKLRLGF